MKTIITASYCALFLAGALSAQPQWINRIAYNGGVGVDETFSTTGSNLRLGRTIQAGVGYKFFPHLDLMLEGEYDAFALTTKALDSLGYPAGYPAGHVHGFAIDVNPTWHFRPEKTFDYYVFGGGGSYHWNLQLTRPTTATATGTNAFFGFNTPGYAASESALSQSYYKPGLDAGAGVSFKTRYHAKLYVEAKYDFVFLSNGQHMSFLPGTIGIRW